MTWSSSPSPDPLTAQPSPAALQRTKPPPQEGQQQGVRRVLSKEYGVVRTKSNESTLKRKSSGEGNAVVGSSRIKGSQSTTSTSQPSSSTPPINHRTGRPTWAAVQPAGEDEADDESERLAPSTSTIPKADAKPARQKKRKQTMDGPDPLNLAGSASNQDQPGQRAKKISKTAPTATPHSQQIVPPVGLPNTPGLTSSEPDGNEAVPMDVDEPDAQRVVQTDIGRDGQKGAGGGLRVNVLVANASSSAPSREDSPLTPLPAEYSTPSPNLSSFPAPMDQDHHTYGSAATTSSSFLRKVSAAHISGDTSTSDTQGDVLGPVPLLLYLAMEARKDSNFLLPLILLPQHLLDQKLSEDPELLNPILDYLRSNGIKYSSPKRTDLLDMYSHYSYLSLSLLQTAWDQTVVRLTDSDRVMIGIEVGKIGMDILTFLQRQIDQDTRELEAEAEQEVSAPSRKAESAIFGKEDVEDTPSLSHLKRTGSELDVLPKQDKPQDQGLLRKTSSIRIDLDGGVKGEGGERVLEDEKLIRRRKAERKTRKDLVKKRVQEAGKVLRDVETIVSQSLKACKKLATGSRNTAIAKKWKTDMYDLTILLARLSHLQSGQNYAMGILKRMKEEIAGDESQRVMFYRVVLMLAEWESEGSGKVTEAANMLRETSLLARKHGDKDVSAIFSVAAARLVMAHSYFDLCAQTLDDVITNLGLDPSWVKHAQSPGRKAATSEADAGTIKTIVPLELEGMDLFRSSLVSQYLMLRISWEIRIGRAETATAFLVQLHSVIDHFELEFKMTGIAEIAVGDDIMRLQVTQPNVLTAGAYLTSCIAKPSFVGTKPKRMLYAREGLKVYDSLTSAACWDVSFADNTSLAVVDDMHRNLMANKAALMVDMVALAIARVEYEKAEEHVIQLIDHVREFSMFSSYFPRIAFLLGQLAQSRGQLAKAIEYYSATQHVTNVGSEIELAARLSLMCMRIGHGTDLGDSEFQEEVREIVEEANKTGAVCLVVAADVIEGVTEQTITASKQALRDGIATALPASLNQAHCLLLALICVGHYQDVNDEYCMDGLAASYQTVRSMAMYARSDGVNVGHLTMGLWLGERLEACYRMKEEGNEEIKKKLKRQIKLNELHRSHIKELEAKLLLGTRF